MKTGLRLAAFAVALVAFGAIVTVGPRLTVPQAEAATLSQFAGAVGNAAVAANRPGGEFAMLLLLNGEPASGSSTATATGSDNTISVTGGGVYELNCTTDSVYLPGTTVTTTTGSSIYVGAPKYVVTSSSTTTLAFRARSSAGTCVANRLQ